MTSDGYWINNEHIVFKHAIKPCKICGFCPYGQLVEDFPLPSISRSIAIEHNNYMVEALAKGTFDKPNPDMPYLMTREEAIAEIENFNPEEYSEDIAPEDLTMKCNIFGHHCPVYYHAELLAEEDPVTEEEIKLFENEMHEYMDKVEAYHKKIGVDE